MHKTLTKFAAVNRQITDCQQCARLVEHCQQVARDKRAAFRECDYWGRPVPNFGDPRARLLIVGLAPAAHGANRTGRMFTGDRSGEWMYRALHKAGFANQATATARDDGLTLHDCLITAVAHCAPPANKPTDAELTACSDWLRQTIDLVPVQVIVVLGQIAWRWTLAELRRRQWHTGSLAGFAHGAQLPLAGQRRLIGSYHPSQQNTFTGRLTEAMFDDIFTTARRLLSS